MSRSNQKSYARNQARVAELEDRAARIRRLNDQFRSTFTGGRIMLTSGIQELASDVRAMVLRKVALFTQFDGDNDPHHEHDLGGFTIAGERVLWKIDYYDKDLEYGSPDPADPEVTARVLTIMLASEY